MDIVAWVPITLGFTGAMLLVQALTGSRGFLKPVILLMGFFVGLWSLTLLLMGGSRGQLDTLTVILLGFSGLALISKPLAKVRWAALLALTSGSAITYYTHLIIGGANVTFLILIFLASTLLIYLLLKFAEDLICAVGSIFNFPPASILTGLACLLWALKLTIH
ncbi:MAG: hypothetical protein QXH17_01610 [Candidatus Bathyarchaeia archaeon]